MFLSQQFKAKPNYNFEEENLAFPALDNLLRFIILKSNTNLLITPNSFIVQIPQSPNVQNIKISAGASIHFGHM